MVNSQELGSKWLPGFQKEGPACDMDKEPIGYFTVPNSLVPSIVERMVNGDALSFALYADIDSSPLRFCYRMIDRDGSLSSWAFGDLFMKKSVQPVTPPTATAPVAACPPVPSCPSHTSTSNYTWILWLVAGFVILLILRFVLSAMHK